MADQTGLLSKEKVMEMNLEIIGQPTNRIKHLSAELSKLGVEINVHALPGDYRPGRIPFIKRFQLRTALYNQMILDFNGDPKETIFLVSQYPPVFAPLLGTLSLGFHTILDIRNTWQEWTHHGFLKQRVEKWEQLQAMKKVDAITHVHQGLRRHLVEHVDPEKIHFITNGTNTGIFNYQPANKKLTNARLNLIYAGRFLPYHYLTVWLDVMKLLQYDREDISLVFVGHGPRGKEIENYIRENQLENVSLITGDFSQEELAGYLNEADYALACVDPANQTLYNTTILTKSFEALTCGVPVLSYMGQETTDFDRRHGLKFNRNFGGWTAPQIKAGILELPVLSDVEKIMLSAKCQILFSFKRSARGFKRLMEQILSSKNVKTEELK